MIDFISETKRRIKERLFTRHFVILMGLGLGMGMSLVVLIIFMIAYFHGKAVLITINQYHEANIEIIAFPIVFVWIIIAFILYFKGIK